MRGFTLLEILVALGLLVIILIIIYGAYTSNIEAIQVARQSGNVSQTARIILDRMSKDLESAFINYKANTEGIQLGMIGQDNEIEDKPADRIDFTSLTHLALEKESLSTDLCEISYYLEEDQDNDSLILYRRDHAIIDDDITSGGNGIEFGTMITGFDITYQDREGNSTDAWDTIEGEQKDKLPQLVTIKLIIKDEDGREHVFTTSVHPVMTGH